MSDKTESKGRTAPRDAVLSPGKPVVGAEGGQSLGDADADRNWQLRHFTGSGRLVDQNRFRRRDE